MINKYISVWISIETLSSTGDYLQVYWKIWRLNFMVAVYEITDHKIKLQSPLSKANIIHLT